MTLLSSSINPQLQASQKLLPSEKLTMMTINYFTNGWNWLHELNGTIVFICSPL